MLKKIVLSFLLFISLYIRADEIILRPKALIKLKVKDSTYNELNHSISVRNDFYIICESKNKEIIAVKLRDSKKSLQSSDFIISDYSGEAVLGYNFNNVKVMKLFVFNSTIKLYEIFNYDKDIVKYIFSTWYKITLKNKKILKDEMLEIKDQTLKKDFILLRDNFNIKKILDCFAKDDFVFTLMPPVSYDKIEKKEFNINLN